MGNYDSSLSDVLRALKCVYLVKWIIRMHSQDYVWKLLNISRFNRLFITFKCVKHLQFLESENKLKVKSSRRLFYIKRFWSIPMPRYRETHTHIRRSSLQLANI